MTGNRRKIRDKSVKDRRRNPPILYWQGNPQRSFLFSRVPVFQRRNDPPYQLPVDWSICIGFYKFRWNRNWD